NLIVIVAEVSVEDFATYYMRSLHMYKTKHHQSNKGCFECNGSMFQKVEQGQRKIFTSSIIAN
ncbi:MAG TPA: hypothetical protein PLZ51_07880, partial [Aggregatilineales bacterium]|nr:hypothetical protein [Aggregatilineales bacterium]